MTGYHSLIRLGAQPAFLLSGNGVISLISPVWTILDPHWVETKMGLALFMFWNLWMMVLMIVLLRHHQKK